jgi:hypothetical protein
MASSLPENNKWEETIYQLEKDTPVLGGPGGPDNIQAQQLANRTQYLKFETLRLNDLTMSATAAYDSKEKAQKAIDDGIETRRFFTVWSDSSLYWTEKYENVNGIATPTGDTLASGAYVFKFGYQASEAFKRSRNIVNINDAYDEFGHKIIGGIATKTGQVPFYINNRGDTSLSGLKVINMPGGGPGLVYTDMFFRPYACSPGYPNKEGLPVIGGVSEKTEPEIPDIDYRGVMGVQLDGQSLPAGATDPEHVKIVNGTQPYNNVMFSGSIRSSTPETDTFSPLIESNLVIPGFEQYPQSETYLSSFLNELTRKLMIERGVSNADELPFKFFGATHAVAGLKLSELMKGSESYDKFIRYVTNAMRLANAEGEIYSELCRYFSQGQSDYRDATPMDEWEALFIKNATDKNRDMRAITGQGYDSIIVAEQLASHRAYNRVFPSIALSIRKLAHAGHIQISCPAYVGKYVDGVHMSPDEYIYCGRLAQRSLHRALQNNKAGKPFGVTWLAIINENVQGTVHEYVYNVPTPPLRIKTDLVWETPNYGFEVVNRDTYDYIDIITSVAVTAADRITVITSRPLSENEVMTYGWGVTQLMGKSGRINGPRGNICDSSGDLPGESYEDSTGVMRPMDDYAEIWMSER